MATLSDTKYNLCSNYSPILTLKRHKILVDKDEESAHVCVCVSVFLFVFFSLFGSLTLDCYFVGASFNVEKCLTHSQYDHSKNAHVL